MQTCFIMAFAAEYLKQNPVVTPGCLQRFIKDDPAVGKILPAEDVEAALGSLVDHGVLEVDVDKNDEVITYKRRPSFFHKMGLKSGLELALSLGSGLGSVGSGLVN